MHIPRVFGILVVATVSAWPPIVCATGPKPAEPDADLNGRVLQELYGGVVANQTMTVVGQDFYQYFVALWRDKQMSDRYEVSIHERPSARWGSQIWVEYAQRRVFQAVLPPARANIRSLTEQAVEIAYQNIVETEMQRLLFKDSDVGPDEI
jgi:curli production assembly/transport component CsgE